MVFFFLRRRWSLPVHPHVKNVALRAYPGSGRTPGLGVSRPLGQAVLTQGHPQSGREPFKCTEFTEALWLQGP